MEKKISQVTKDFTEPGKGLFKGGLSHIESVESKTKGTMILRCGGCFYKVLKLRSTGDNNYLFEYNDLNTKENKILQCQMRGLNEAANRAFQEMKSPKDILFLDLDRNGEWKIVAEDQIKGLKL